MKYVILAVCLTAVTMCDVRAKAATKIVLVDGDGKRVTFDAAILRASKGEKIFKCQEVKPVLNKSGTALTLKVVK